MVGALIFLPAGTLAYTKGWLLMGLLFVPMLIAGFVMFFKSPAFLAKRLDAREKQATQKGVLAFSGLMFIGGFVVAGLDYRFGWSNMPPAAYNYAAKNYPRMKAFTKAAQVAGMATACFFIIVFEVFASRIIWLFIRDKATISYGMSFLRIACLATPFMISNFQKIYCLQAMGKGKESLILGVCRQGLFAIPILLILNHFVGLYGVVAAQLISDAITFILSTFIYRKVYNSLQKEIAV